MGKFLTDEQMAALEAEQPKQPTAPKFLSDEDMAKLEAAPTAVPTPKLLTDEQIPNSGSTTPKLDQPTVSKPIRSDGIGDDVVAGVQQAILPFTVSKETARKQRSGVELGAMVVADLGASIAAGAAAGAAVGSVIPVAGTLAGLGAGAVGALIYGIYAGIGREYIRTQSEDGVKFSPLRAGVYALTEANPLIKASKKSINVARAIGQVAAEGAAEYSYKGDMQDAALSAGLSSIGAVMVFRGGARTVNAGTGKVTNDFIQDAGPDIMVKARQKLEQMPNMPNRSDLVPEGFKKWVTSGSSGLTGAQLDIAFTRTQNALGPDPIKKHWSSWLISESMREEGEAYAKKFAAETGAALDEPVSVISQQWKPIRYVNKEVDRKLGTNLEGAVDMISEADNTFKTVLGAYFHSAGKIKTAADKIKLSGTDISYALEGLTNKVSAQGRKALATTDGKKVLADWRELYKTARDAIKTSGHDIGELQNYVPLQAKGGVDGAFALSEQMKKIRGGNASAQDLKDTAHVISKALNDDSLTKKIFDSDTSLAELRGIIDSNVVKARTAILAPTESGAPELSAAFSRSGGEIPEFMRERDVYKSYARYMQSNFKAMYFQDAYGEFKGQIAALKGAGLDKTVKFYEEYLNNIMGSKNGFGMALTMESNHRKLRWKEAIASQDTSPVNKAMYQGLEQIGELGSFITSLPYSAYLGLNLNGSLRNLGQVPLMTAPEFAGGYGYKLATKGMLEATKDLLGGVNFGKVLREKGMVGNQIGRDMLVEAEHVLGRTAQRIKKVNELSMIPYGASDNINRYWSLMMGHTWAKELKSGAKDATKALEGLSSGYKAKLRVLGGPGKMTDDELGDFLGKYLNAKTQFHYGPTQIHRVGRQFGPFASMFTMWPTTVAADIIDIYKTNGALRGSTRNFAKYMAPSLALYGLANTVLDMKNNPTLQYAIGDLTAAAPLGSIWGMADLGSGGPVVQVPMDAAKGVYKAMHEDGANKKLKAGLNAIAPVVKTFNPIPGMSPIINELERWQKAHGKPTVTKQLIDKVTK